jgi:hypothetical protein
MLRPSYCLSANQDLALLFGVNHEVLTSIYSKERIKAMERNKPGSILCKSSKMFPLLSRLH